MKFSDSDMYLYKQHRDRMSRGEYEPWVNARMAGAIGICSVVASARFKRNMHFLSQGELHFFYNLERCDSVVDIKEQFPLDPVTTFQIAKTLKQRHPRFQRWINNIPTNYYAVMSTDFLVTRSAPDGSSYQEAYSIKVDSNQRTSKAASLAIEREYWESQGIACYLIFSGLFPEHERKALDAFYPFIDLDINQARQLEFASHFKTAYLSDPFTNLHTLLKHVSSSLGLNDIGQSICHFATAFFFQHIRFKFQSPLVLEQPVTLLLEA